MPESHESSLLNGSESVSESVSDKHSQWSDSGLIKTLIMRGLSRWDSDITQTKWVDSDETSITHNRPRRDSDITQSNLGLLEFYLDNLGKMLLTKASSYA